MGRRMMPVPELDPSPPEPLRRVDFPNAYPPFRVESIPGGYRAAEVEVEVILARVQKAAALLEDEALLQKIIEVLYAKGYVVIPPEADVMAWLIEKGYI